MMAAIAVEKMNTRHSVLRNAYTSAARKIRGFDIHITLSWITDRFRSYSKHNKAGPRCPRTRRVGDSGDGAIIQRDDLPCVILPR
jgi:hypothetical protein